MRNILVFYGGLSCEHDVSVITGVLTLNSLDKNKYQAVPVYVSKSGDWFTGESLFDVSFYKRGDFKKLKKVTFLSNEKALYLKGKRLKKLCNVYSIINCMHGLNGEDGCLAGVAKFIGLPIANPDMFGSSFSIDKAFSKIVLKGLNVKTLPYEIITKSEYQNNLESAINKVKLKINYPIILKPANLGSSIGISTANDDESFISSLENAFTYDEKVIIEPMLEDFIELNCACYKDDKQTVVSMVEKPLSLNKILTFSDKYECFKGGSLREFPAKIDVNIAKKIQSFTKKIYNSCDFNGIIRVDFLLKGNDIYCNEINTVPGSLAYYLFTDTVQDFSNLLTKIIEVSVINFNKYISKKFNYSSTVLNVNGAKSPKLKSFDKNRV